MKILKLTLGDNQVYKFSTFSTSQLKGLRSRIKDTDDIQDKINKIRFVYEDDKVKKDEKGNFILKDELSDKENNDIQKLEDKLIDIMLDLCRKSICKNHEEFKISEDKQKEKEIQERLMDLMDINDLKNVVQF